MASLPEQAAIDIKNKRRTSDAEETVGSYPTTAYSSRASSGSRGGSSIDTESSLNLWHRLLSNDSVWDNIHIITNDDDLDEDEDEDLLYYREVHEKQKRCCKPSKDSSDGSNAITILFLTSYYELRHFLRTTFSHPHIWLSSLLVILGTFGLGYWAISSQRDAYVADKQTTAQFVARETADYFAKEFKRAFLPLYSLREAVIHSGHFDELADRNSVV